MQLTVCANRNVEIRVRVGKFRREGGDKQLFVLSHTGEFTVLSIL